MTKRENDSFSIKDILPEFIKENNLQKGMDQMSVKDAWEQVMGQGVMSYTCNVKLKNGTLFVELKSATLREELSYGTDKILVMINEALGRELVNKIHLM